MHHSWIQISNFFDKLYSFKIIVFKRSNLKLVLGNPTLVSRSKFLNWFKIFNNKYIEINYNLNFGVFQYVLTFVSKEYTINLQRRADNNWKMLISVLGPFVLSGMALLLFAKLLPWHRSKWRDLYFCFWPDFIQLLL